MGVIERSRLVRAEPAGVWDVLVDLRRLPQVSPHTVEVKDAPERLTHRGERFTQVVAAVGKRFESEWEVLRFDPGRALAIEGSVGFGVRYCLTQTVEAAGPGRSTLTVRIKYKLPFGPLGRMASRLGVERLATAEADQVLAAIAAFAEKAAADSGAPVEDLPG
ncbi:MAG: SRPBCC family protein [Acidimicrobiales bacterium]